MPYVKRLIHAMTPGTDMHEARQGEQESGSGASLDGTSMRDWTKREGLGHQNLQEAGMDYTYDGGRGRPQAEGLPIARDARAVMGLRDITHHDSDAWKGQFRNHDPMMRGAVTVGRETHTARRIGSGGQSRGAIRKLVE